MRHKVVSLGLALLLSISLVGCGNSPSQTEPAKNTTKITETGSSSPPSTNEPSAATPQEPKQPEDAANSVPGNPSAPADTKSPNTDQGGVNSPVEPNPPKEISLPKGTISLNVGDTLPEFVLPDLEGRNISASSIVTRHKLTMISFWTTT